MAPLKCTKQSPSIWLDETTANFLRLRMNTFYNRDYFERVVLPLLDLPQAARVLDVGCGYGGLSLLLAQLRPDLTITGVDMQPAMLESATQTALQMDLHNLTYQPGDGHALDFAGEAFDAVMCQTVLTHVRDAESVICEMARVLKPGGVFLAVEYTVSGALHAYNSAEESRRDEAWLEKFFRLSRLIMKGKKALGQGDDSLGIRVPLLATAAGLDVFDVRLNDRVLHVIPPYRHPKQASYLELLKAYYQPDPNGMKRYVERMHAAGGSEADATWLFQAEDGAAVLKAIEDRSLAALSVFLLYLTLARKLDPVV